MEGGDSCPVGLESCKKIKCNKYNKIRITSDNFSLGRGLKNSFVVPFLSISKHHCTFKKGKNNKWTLEDNSPFGITINGLSLGRGHKQILNDGDIISLELADELVYKFLHSEEAARKRIILKKKMDNIDQIKKIMNDVDNKFVDLEIFENKHTEDKIQNAKQMQNASMILKEKLQTEINRKNLQLENEFAAQIENLKGEKTEVECRKTILLEERDAQLAAIKYEMKEKICKVMEQIKKHNETESELLKENNSFIEKLLKEREEFDSELYQVNTSKQKILKKLEAKIREQKERHSKERQEFVDMFQQETEQLRLAIEKELKEIQEQRVLRDTELKLELNNIKKNLEDRVHQTEQEKLKAERLLNEQMKHIKKLCYEEKRRLDQLLQVAERGPELATLAVERIRKQEKQSSLVINRLQEELEKVKSQLQSVKTKRNTIFENIYGPKHYGEGFSKELGELMASELQCSICNELFVEPTTLNCSHTFCTYCISVWKRTKNNCPLCRAFISSDCKSLVIKSITEKMVQSLSEEMKKQRKEILDGRKDCPANTKRRRHQ